VIFEIFMVVKGKFVVFRVVAPCNEFNPEDGGSTDL
jgi:hypothetical protein